MELTGSSKLVRVADIISTEIDGETILMDQDMEHYFGMEPVSTEIWKLLENEVTFDQLVRQIVEIYEVASEQCKADVMPFLTKLHERKMIEVTN